MFPPVDKVVLPLTMLVVAGLTYPVPASAQGAAPSSPRYATSSGYTTIRGRIEGIDDKFHLTVRDSRGRLQSVLLHRGTIIHPTGLTLAPGMRVAIAGSDAPGPFDAHVIDTPYSYDGPQVYCGPPGWWYGYGPDVLLLDCPALVQKYQDP